MKRLGLALVAIVSLGFALAQAQNQTTPPIIGNTGAYNSAPPTCTSGNWCTMQTDVNGRLLTTSTSTVTGTVAIDQTTPGTTNGVVVNAGSNIIGKVGIDQTTPGTTNAVVATGNVASGATDSGNPLKIGGVYTTTPPPLTTGQRGDVQLDVNSNIRARLTGLIITAADALANNSIATATNTADNAANNRPLTIVPYKFNSSTWDRDFTCANSAVINVTAAATTELVSLTASQVIRVCSFTITESLSGTAKFVYGTGSNCGTGTTDLTGAMAVGTNSAISQSSGNGSLFRTASANALCLTAVTGNITGFVTYAKY